MKINNILHIDLRRLAGYLCLGVVSLGFGSCDNLVYDDQGDCDPYYRVRFRYDKNMKWADAFPNEVNEVTLYVIDDETGHIVWSKYESGEILRAEGYEMEVEVPPGTYSLLAWCGEGHTTHFSIPPLREDGPTHHIELTATLNRDHDETGKAYIDNDIKRLYHGRLDTQVFPEKDGTYVYTVSLTKDTNDVHVVLQHLSGEPVDHTKFTFSITDNNGFINHDNNLLDDEHIEYRPWQVKSGTAGVEITDPETKTRAVTQVSAAVADLTTSRLVKGQNSRLHIRNEKGETIVSIPLIDYCLLVRGRYEHEMGEQEYLDRQDDYSMVFFLDEKDQWITSHIYINSWMVILQNTEL